VRAKAHPEGAIDLSVGTPVDSTPEFIQQELSSTSNSPGYPLTIGSPTLREAMRSWAINQLGITGDFDVLPTIGSKEFIAWLPSVLESKNVLYPKIAYPTYLVSALIAHAKHEAVDTDPIKWPAADLVWVNSPSNPTGRVAPLSELEEILKYSRKNSSVVVSDECYINFPADIHATEPISIFKAAAGNNENLVGVYSLSKRSNMAGYRAGLVVGDSALIAKIREVRKHAGMILSAPVQAAMIAALGDEKHVQLQAERYARRRSILRPALESLGFKVEHTEAGLYIWCTRGEADMDSVAFLADRGVLVTPGHFYGEAGAKYIRVALTATDDQITRAAARMNA
jgi:succinyldiaminopimelate transaminase